MEEYCNFCNKEVSKETRDRIVSQRVVDRLQSSVDSRGVGLEVQPGDIFHRNCRKRLLDTRSTGKEEPTTPSRVPRVQFDYKLKCIFCCQEIFKITTNQVI